MVLSWRRVLRSFSCLHIILSLTRERDRETERQRREIEREREKKTTCLSQAYNIHTSYLQNVQGKILNKCRELQQPHASQHPRGNWPQDACRDESMCVWLILDSVDGAAQAWRSPGPISSAFSNISVSSQQVRFDFFLSIHAFSLLPFTHVQRVFSGLLLSPSYTRLQLDTFIRRIGHFH